MRDPRHIRAGIYGRQSTGNAKSIKDQLTECGADVQAQGWTLVGTYQDGTSASRYARRVRDDWARVLADIRAGQLDVLVLWESSRGDRTPETWFGLLSLCRETSVMIRVTSHGRTYDMASPRDWRTLAEDGIDSAYETEKLSLRTRRGVASAAAAGRPAMGRAPYGYRRVYDPHTGKLIGQEPDPGTAPVVAEIIERIARSTPVSAICDDLNQRGIPAPLGGRWRRQRVREVALNVAYIGKRRHRGQTYDAIWPAIVDDETFYAATRVLTDPARMAQGRHARPGRQAHLLTYLATCYRGHPLRGQSIHYSCPAGCISLRRDKLDGFVRDVVIERLSRPDAYTALRQVGADADQEVIAARAEAAELRRRLDEWRASAIRGETTPASLAAIEAGLTARIREAESRARRAQLPPALRQVLEPGADVRARWDAATVHARRDVIRTLMNISVRPAGQSAFVPVHERVDITWR